MHLESMKIIIKNRNMQKISGKKSPLIIGNNIVKLKNAYSYQKIHNIKVPLGMEFVFFQFKIKSKLLSKRKTSIPEKIEETKQIKRDSSEYLVVGKILARSSSDLMSIIANKLLHTPKYQEYIEPHNLMLVQYPINAIDHIKRLILLSEININSIQAEIEKQEDLLYDFSEKFRKILGKIADDYVNDNGNNK